MIQVEKDNRGIYLWLLIAVAVVGMVSVAVSQGRRLSEWKHKFESKEQECRALERRVAVLDEELAGEKEKNVQLQRLVAEGELKNQALRVELTRYFAVAGQEKEQTVPPDSINQGGK